MVLIKKWKKYESRVQLWVEVWGKIQPKVAVFIAAKITK